MVSRTLSLGCIQLCELRLSANGFLRHQIRFIASCLLLVGQGAESPQIVDRLLDVETHPERPEYKVRESGDEKKPLDTESIWYRGAQSSAVDDEPTLRFRFLIRKRRDIRWR